MHVGSIPERGGFCFLVPRQIQTLRPHVKQKCFTKYVARIYEVVKLKKLRAVLRARFLLGIYGKAIRGDLPESPFHI